MFSPKKWSVLLTLNCSLSSLLCGKKGYLLNNCVVENGEETDRTRVIATGFHQVHVVTAKQLYTFSKENPEVQDKPLELSAVFYPPFSALEKKRRDMCPSSQVQQPAAD